MAATRSFAARVPWVSIGSLALIAPVAAVDTRPMKERAADWVATHPRQLPSSFERFAEYPAEYQRAIFSALPAVEKTAVMVGRLTHALNTTAGLSADQTDLLKRAIAAVGAFAYAPDGGASGRGELARLCQESADLLTGPLAGILEPGIAPHRLTWETPLAAIIVRAREAVNGFGSMYAGTCDCAVDTFCSSCTCAPNTPEGSVCTSTSNGCGCFWAWPCDGVCIG